MMLRYHIFMTNKEGKEEIAGSHYHLEMMCKGIEGALRRDKFARDFVTIAACREEDDGSITELVRWKRGSDVPVFDIRNQEEQSGGE